ncbi:hypothetical protein BH10BAC5_BH10BAC5_03720 [soil metagenome]
MNKLKFSLFLVLLLVLKPIVCSAQWIQNDGIYGGIVYTLSKSGNNVFAGTAGMGVYKSTNNGQTWIQTINNLYVTALLASDNIIFAGGYPNTGANGNLYFSTNEGNTWNVSTLSNTEVYSLAKLNNTIFAGTQTGLFISNDDGQNWFQSSLLRYVSCIQINNNEIFAGTNEGLFVSTNLGLNWNQIGNLGNVKSLACNNSYIYSGGLGGIYSSSNNGLTWQYTIITSYNINSIVIKKNMVFAGTVARGVYFSTNNGVNWTQSSMRETVNSLITKDSLIFAATNGIGVFVSSNNGVYWAQTALNNRYIYSIASSGTDLYSSSDFYGVYKSTNNGSNWIITSLNDKLILSLTAINNDIFGVGAAGIYHTSNGGMNWTLDTQLSNYGIKNLSSSGNNLIAIGSDHIYLSTNIGNSWVSILNSPQTISMSINQNNIYLQGSVGISISTNLGANWITRFGPNQGSMSGLAVNENGIYVSVQFGGIYRSTNQGVNWTSIGLNNHLVTALEVFGDNIIAGANDQESGIFLSTNNGLNWVNKSQGFNGIPNFHSFLITNEYVYITTTDYSIWRRSISDIVGIQNINSGTPSGFSLSQNYPNPFNPTTNINFAIPVQSFVTLKVYDILGKEVKELVNKKLSAGSYSVDFNASEFSSGIYFYSLSANNFQQTKQMLLIK